MNRIIYIDYLKSFAILLVVEGHILANMNSSPETLFVGRLCLDNILFRIIYSFHMPLFFYASGFLSHYRITRLNTHNFPEFIKKKTIQLIIPFLFAGSVLWLTNYCDTITYYWYLRSLFEYYLIVACLFLFSRHWDFSEKYIFYTLLVISFLGIALIKFANNSLLDNIFDFGSFYNFPFFCMGLLFREYKLEKYIKAIPPSIYFVVYIVFFILYSIDQNIVIREICASLMILFVIDTLSGYKVFDKERRVIMYISSHTINIYIVHFFFLFFLKDYFIKVDNSVVMFVYLTITSFSLTFILTALSLACSNILERAPLLRTLLFGRL